MRKASGDSEAAAIPVVEAVVAAVLMASVVLLASRLPHHDPAAAPASDLEATADALAATLASLQVNGVVAASAEPTTEGWFDALLRGDAVVAADAETAILGQLPADMGYALRMSTGQGTLDVLPWGRVAAPPEGSVTGFATILPNLLGNEPYIGAPTVIHPGEALDSSTWACLLAPEQQDPGTLAAAMSGRGPGGAAWVDLWRADGDANVPVHVPYGKYAVYTTGTTNGDGTCSAAGGAPDLQLELVPDGADPADDDLFPYTFDVVVWRRG